MDGNDKDDTEHISVMLQELAEGCDFVQAPSFIKGGPASYSRQGRLPFALSTRRS